MLFPLYHSSLPTIHSEMLQENNNAIHEFKRSKPPLVESFAHASHGRESISSGTWVIIIILIDRCGMGQRGENRSVSSGVSTMTATFGAQSRGRMRVLLSIMENLLQENAWKSWCLSGLLSC